MDILFLLIKNIFYASMTTNQLASALIYHFFLQEIVLERIKKHQHIKDSLFASYAVHAHIQLEKKINMKKYQTNQT